MAIKEEEQKKNGMKNATEKLNMKVADISDKMTLTEIREYLRRVEKGESVKDLLENKDIKKIELDQLQKLASKQTS